MRLVADGLMSRLGPSTTAGEPTGFCRDHTGKKHTILHAMDTSSECSTTTTHSTPLEVHVAKKRSASDTRKVRGQQHILPSMQEQNDPDVIYRAYTKRNHRVWELGGVSSCPFLSILFFVLVRMLIAIYAHLDNHKNPIPASSSGTSHQTQTKSTTSIL